MLKLKTNEHGKVNSLLRTGKDMVSDQLSVSAAQHVINSGKKVKYEDNKIVVDDKWFFDGEPVASKKKGAKSE